MIFRLSTIIFFCITYNLTALSQVLDDFSDGDLTNTPAWTGDIDDFIVNEAFQLQLNADAAGVSNLYLPINIEAEQIWEFDIELDFAPSNDNRLEVYYHIDDPDIETANGYFFKIGESGSNDALVFYRLDGGVRTEIARGIDGSLGNDPAKVNIRIVKTQSLYEVYTNYEGLACKEQELMFSDASYDQDQANFFLVNCNYTSTRVDKFFFDNLAIYNASNDTTGPVAQSADLVNPTEIEIYFDEPLDLISSTDAMHFNLNESPIEADEITLNGLCMDKIAINLSSPIASGITNVLSISGIMDQNGNLMSSSQYFDLVLLESPGPGDIILTEILFNPFPGGSDFVELYNNSGKFLLLTDLVIENVSKGDSKTIDEKLIMSPYSYLALSENPAHLWQTYAPTTTANIFEQDIPSFNDDAGNVSLSYDGALLDSFDYSEDLHFELIKDPEGVSLEKLDIETSSNEISNWHSASSIVLYATPGYENSQSENFNEDESMISLKNRIFSPDQDGFEDLLFVEFNLSNTGYLATIKIVDLRGMLIRNLSNNELISSNGIVKWDGLNDDGQKTAIGSYVILIKLFHPDGTHKIFKKTCVVSGGFN
jgi:hypothetical protein